MNEITSVEELKSAMKSGKKEFTVTSPEVVKYIKIIINIKKYGPWAVAAAVAAIPMMIATAPASVPVTATAMYFIRAAGAAGVATSGSVFTLAAFAIGVGGVVLAGMFTDWEYIEFPGGFTMKRSNNKRK